MKELDETTKRKLRKAMSAAEIVDKGDMAVLAKIMEFEDTVEEQIEKVDTVIEQANEAIASLREPRDGKDADEEAIEARMHEKMHKEMMEMMPDKEEIIKEVQSKITPTIVERVIEKTETIKELPVITKETTEVQVLDEKKLEESLPKYGTQIRDGLELLQKGEKLSIQAIEDLSDILEELRRMARTSTKGSGAGVGTMALNAHFIDDETPSGTIDGNNTAFTLANSPVTSSLKVYLGGSRQRVTEDYTLSGRTITFTIAPQVGEVLLVDYRT
jgi:hypothetical protein